MTQAIFFDIGNVLVFFDYAKMFEQIARICGTTSQEVEEMIIANRLGIQYETGLITTDQIFELFQRKASKPISRTHFLR